MKTCARSLVFAIIVLATISSYSQVTKSAITDGDWDDPATWSPSGVPGDDEVILIDAGRVVTVNGTDHTMNNTVLIIRGELIMRSVLTEHPSLTFTGDGGVIIEDGGMVTDESLLGDFSYIEVDGHTYWSGGTLGGALGLCTINCGDEVGDYASVGETAFPGTLGNPLPVELIYFQTEKSDNGVLVLWATASELNNSHFEIEKSFDGTNFQKLGDINGNGTTSDVNKYTFLDQHPKFMNLTYYRLKQIDYDGSHEYFVSVFYPQSGLQHKIDIFPNPFREKLMVRFNYAPNEDIQVSIHSTSGKEMHTLKFPNSNGTLILENELLGLPAGQYFIQLKGQTVRYKYHLYKN